MELVNPLSAFVWREPLDIDGVPMMGVPEKQGWSFSRAGWLAGKMRAGVNADAHGLKLRRGSRPLSRPTLEGARAAYQARDARRFPKYFIIEPINICNRACPFCSITVMERFDANGKLIRGMMEWMTFCKLMEECGQHDVYGISLYQLGEPLLWRGRTPFGQRLTIADMARVAREVGGFKTVNISTNGDVDNLDVLLGAECDDLIISIDGTTPEVYVENRPPTNKREPDPFGSTVRRVRDFLAAKVAGGHSKPFVRMQIINKENTRDQVLDFIRQWIAVPGVGDVFVKNLDSMRPWLGNRVVGDAEDAIKADRVANMPCQHIYSVGSMVVDGTLNACCHDAKTVLTDRSNINTGSFADWWNGPYMSGLRASHEAGRFGGVCGECRERDAWLG